ncbi:MAG: sugar phosphate isomerase/epimerase family protein [Pirellulales bacterium]
MARAAGEPSPKLRLGTIGLFGRYLKFQDPQQWVALHTQWGFHAADCPVPIGAPDDMVRHYGQAAKEADIAIAQVGAWSNPISLDDKIRKQGLERNIRGLQLADEIGALCCVNASGSLGERLSSEHRDNLTEETFALIVDTVRQIIDAVKPRRAFYALEPMPYTYPNSADSYLRLLEAIDRPAFAVQFDPVNLINSPEKYYHTAGVIKEFVRKLGPHIKSSHLKDVKMQSQVTVHIDEVRLGTGNLHVATFLCAMANLKDVPILMEHMKSEAEYRQATAHVRAIAKQAGVNL